jgi:hypothetical protein
MVVVDGKSETVDLKEMPEGVRAVQWDGAAGHVEYRHQPNEPIDSIDDYQWVVDAWEAAAAESENKEQARRDNMAKLKIEAEAEWVKAGTYFEGRKISL